MILKYTQRFLDLVKGYEKPGEDLPAVRFETRECDCGKCKKEWICTTTLLPPDLAAMNKHTKYHHVHASNVEAVVPDVAQPESNDGAIRPCATEPAGEPTAAGALDTGDPA